MYYESGEALNALSRKPENARNFCMVAHVDHGKTTLSDYLVASNGILSQQLAGEVRLMDSRPDEQERCITMKASSITLHHKYQNTQHVLNLVDSPGHIDFSCEVSTAMRLCDGAVIIVDVVDGVTQQTNSMLRHAYREGLSMCLVLNKIDLLITTLGYSAEDGYFRLRSIIESCNATLAAYANQMAIQNIEQDIVREDHSEDGVWFDPCKDNVLFCSCHDNWAFSLSVFCEFYKDKIAIENLQESLWGESRYFHPDKKTIESTPAKPGQPHVSVQLLLDPIWRMYSTFLGEDSTDENRLKLTNKLKIPEKLWNNPRSDNRAKLKSVMGAWMPLAKCVLDTICREMDSPVTAQQRRLPGLVTNFADVPSRTKEALLKCDPSPDAPCVVYVCKLIDTQYLVGRTIGSVEEAENAFIGFARVYSGCLRTGQPIYLLSDGEQVQTEVRKVFLFRGAGLEEADEIYAGSLCGIGGLTSYICKHATISTEADIPPFKPLVLPSTSIVRLSVFPKNPKDADNLEKGLRLLYKVDPQVDVSVLPTGEHVIGTAGEVHAERCVKDLVETFAQVEIETSEPIVSFRETIVGPLSNKMRTHTVNLMDGAVVFSVCARPFPEDVLEIIKDDTRNVANDASLLAQLEGLLKENKRYSEAMESGIISCGPRRQGFVGAVLLADFRGAENPEAHASTLSEWKEAVVAGFQAATESGPMAQEPLYGMAFIITELLFCLSGRLVRGMTPSLRARSPWSRGPPCRDVRTGPYPPGSRLPGYGGYGVPGSPGLRVNPGNGFRTRTGLRYRSGTVPRVNRTRTGDRGYRTG
ncbi:elongation factor 2 [Angomonas deanei]|nr:elongation factor 2 [Angomonas deanei]|eukprot:EPY42421.1 elongation factor 2 [Angomonas deanei]